MKKKSFTSRGHRNQPTRPPEPKAAPKKEDEQIQLVLIRLSPPAFDWLSKQAGACDTSPEAMLTLLADVGRTILEMDPFNPFLLQTLQLAGYDFYRPNLDQRWRPLEDDDLPF